MWSSHFIVCFSQVSHVGAINRCWTISQSRNHCIWFTLLIRSVPQLPRLLESKSVILPDAFVLCRISLVGLILSGDLGVGRSLEAHADLEAFMLGWYIWDVLDLFRIFSWDVEDLLSRISDWDVVALSIIVEPFDLQSLSFWDFVPSVGFRLCSDLCLTLNDPSLSLVSISVDSWYLGFRVAWELLFYALIHQLPQPISIRFVIINIFEVNMRVIINRCFLGDISSNHVVVALDILRISLPRPLDRDFLWAFSLRWANILTRIFWNVEYEVMHHSIVCRETLDVGSCELPVI